MITLTKWQIPGSRNPEGMGLPRFKEAERNSVIGTEDSLPEEYRELLGYETAPRYLPYTMKDCYDRERANLDRNVIVLENDILKAVFLPEFGGRLYSLYHKKLKKELLFKNSVIQPANLAILDAWIAGGIEWNAGQLGHAFSTCAPLFCSVLKDEDGNEFLRMYEYERCHNIFWHMDFHLPPGSGTLNVYVRMINDRNQDTSAYWWTNIAVPEVEKARVYSETDEVIYLNMSNLKYGQGRLPNLPTIPEVDATYPARITYANEYFFQTPETEQAPWEAVVYPDNGVFFERSSSLLRYRKMFCWGNHQGGKHWKDYLSEKNQGDYIEIQGGLSRTQHHGMVFPAHSEIEFVQCFGGMDIDTGEFYENDWNRGRVLLKKKINQQLDSGFVEKQLEALRKYRNNTPERLLFQGSGYGALERKRREAMGEQAIPAGMVFPEESLGEEQKPWLKLLSEGCYKSVTNDIYPVSYMTQPEWRRLLEKSIAECENQQTEAYLQYGIMLTEDCEYEKAAEVFEELLKNEDNALAFRNLGFIRAKQGRMEEALEAYSRAVRVSESANMQPIYLEYLQLMRSHNRFEEMWFFYSRLPEYFKEDERIYLEGVFAALNTGRLSFAEQAFKRKYVYVRENQSSITELWKEYHRRKYPDMENTEEAFPLPYELDFQSMP